MSEMNISLDRWRAQYILEALKVLEENWLAIMQGTDDEDVQSEYGNDFAQLQILQEGFERQAVEAFGPSVTNFSREPLVSTVPKHETAA